MEVAKDAFWLDKNHPNYTRWERSRRLSVERGKLVRKLVETERECRGLKILDLGSGEGGTSFVFADDNYPFSVDIDIIRLKRQHNAYDNYPKLLGSAVKLPFNDRTFDLIILQDVIEHIPSAEQAAAEIHRVLRQGGLVYLSTPNKISLFNIAADPHWGFPLVSLMNRPAQKKFFLRFFRKAEMYRTDTAQLLSFRDLKRLLSAGFEIKIKTSEVVDQLIVGNKGIVWSRFHLKLLALIHFLGLSKIIKLISNNRFGFINNFLTPTFYFILRKK